LLCDQFLALQAETQIPRFARDDTGVGGLLVAMRAHVRVQSHLPLLVRLEYFAVRYRENLVTGS